MRQLLGVISLDERSIDIDNLGYKVDLLLLSSVYFNSGLTVRESLKVVLSYLNRLNKESQELIEDTLKSLDLLQAADQLTYTLSGGQAKKWP